MGGTRLNKPIVGMAVMPGGDGYDLVGVRRQHGARAASMGGAEVPGPVRAMMRLTARALTEGSYWL